MHPYAWATFGYNGFDVADFLHNRGYRCFDAYLGEHRRFEDGLYTGPCLLVPDSVDPQQRDTTP